MCAIIRLAFIVRPTAADTVGYKSWISFASCTRFFDETIKTRMFPFLASPLSSLSLICIKSFRAKQTLLESVLHYTVSSFVSSVVSSFVSGVSPFNGFPSTIRLICSAVRVSCSRSASTISSKSGLFSKINSLAFS